MTTLRETCQMALEALELAQTDVHWELNSPTRKFLRKAEKNLRAALAEPVQEPVAIRLSNGVIDVLGGALVPIGTLLYTAPPQRKPLTLKDVERLIYEETKINPNVADDRELLGYIVNAVRAIERAHGIGEKDE